MFPGGNVDPTHDGRLPASETPQRHEDGPTYRKAAIRETFEECGILLARHGLGLGGLVDMDEEARNSGRHDVHNNITTFGEWLASKNIAADVGKFVYSLAQGDIITMRFIVNENS